MTAVAVGPYWTWRVTQAGAWGRVRCPQAQRLAHSRYSVTSTLTGGRSKTWRHSTLAAGVSSRPAPQAWQCSGVSSTR
jgi:hypothetical protein